MYVIVRLALSASPADNSRFAVGFVRKTRELKSACVLWVAEKLVRYRETPYRQRSRQSPTHSFANAKKGHISPIYGPCKLMAEPDGSGFALCRIGNAASWPLIDDGSAFPAAKRNGWGSMNETTRSDPKDWRLYPTMRRPTS